jgi:glycosyltransferase involved in cell wall biosynthesis
VITDAGPHPYFGTLLQAGEIPPGGQLVGCVGPSGALQRDMSALGAGTFSLGARGRAGYPRAVLHLAGLLRRVSAPIVQSHLVDGSLVGLFAARLAGTPVRIFTAHHSHELPFHGRRLVLVDRLCAAGLATHVIAPSQQVRDVLVERAGVPPKKITVVHHGFDLERLNPTAIEREEARRRLGLSGRTTFGALGRIYWLKNQIALLEAFADIIQDGTDADLAIAGLGDYGPVRERARQLRIEDRVVCVGPTDARAFLSAIDVFVHPALAESFGMVIIEAMAMAKPVVCTPVGIAPEVVVSGTSGILCESASRAAIAGGLRTILGVDHQWGTIGAAARESVGGFTARAMARNYKVLYSSWLQATKQAGPQRRST